jgi:tetratricopeptide (TPR) repeat protein
MTNTADGTPRVLCLNMIVRNEAAIIERCLAAAAPAIGAYVIGDTGSTDDTPARIRAFFDARGIPGEIHHFPFHDFAQARNEALARARASRLAFDYLLLGDADMELVVDNAEFTRGLDAAGYRLLQRSGIAYWNLRLVRRNARARYVGATHEYLDVEGTVESLEGAWYRDHADGASRPEKYERDLRLLRAELAEDPANARNLFYLARTLQDAGRPAEAREAYARRVAAGGWEEERWYAQYSIGLCDLALGEYARGVEASLVAHGRRPWRAEPLHVAARCLRELGRHDEALDLCDRGAQIALPSEDILFVDENVYRYGFAEEASISGYYSEREDRYAAGERLCEELATGRDVPLATRNTARGNAIYYARTAAECFGEVALTPIGVGVAPPWHAFNPSLAYAADGATLLAAIRLADYRVDAGQYVLADGKTVRSRVLLATLDRAGVPTRLREMKTSPATRDVARFESSWHGFEDCRLFVWRGKLHACATVRDRNPEQRAEVVLLTLDPASGIERVEFMRGYASDRHQKNWLPFVEDDELNFIYATDPLTVLRFDERARDVRLLHEASAPRALDHLRGGAAPIAFDGGWLYAVHEVTAVEGRGRCYLHRFVALARDYRIAAVTRPFCLTRRGVEFVSGMVASGDELLLGFGVDDREPWLARLAAEAVRKALAQGRIDD